MRLVTMLEKMSEYSKADQVVSREEVWTECFGLRDMRHVCTAGFGAGDVLFAELRHVGAIRLANQHNHYGNMTVVSGRARQLLDLFKLWEDSDTPIKDRDCSCDESTPEIKDKRCPKHGSYNPEDDIASWLQAFADR